MTKPNDHIIERVLDLLEKTSGGDVITCAIVAHELDRLIDRMNRTEVVRENDVARMSNTLTLRRTRPDGTVLKAGAEFDFYRQVVTPRFEETFAREAIKLWRGVNVLETCDSSQQEN